MAGVMLRDMDTNKCLGLPPLGGLWPVYWFAKMGSSRTAQLEFDDGSGAVKCTNASSPVVRMAVPIKEVTGKTETARKKLRIPSNGVVSLRFSFWGKVEGQGTPPR